MVRPVGLEETGGNTWLGTLPPTHRADREAEQAEKDGDISERDFGDSEYSSTQDYSQSTERFLGALSMSQTG